ncbi:Voltage-dependent T-type calcium channel subunit alpha-1G [Anthophora quadrimaculata]
MSLHYPQGYRYRPATKAAVVGNGEQGSDSDVAELSDLEDDEDEDGGDKLTNRRVIRQDEEEDDDEDDEDDDDEDDDQDDEEEEDNEEDDGVDDVEGDDLPYPGFVPVALRYLDQNTRPRNWCLALITNPYPFGS